MSSYDEIRAVSRRPVLSEISTNVGKPNAVMKKRTEGSFSIFCDATAPQKPVHSTKKEKARKNFDSHEDKENFQPKQYQVKGEGLRVQPRLPALRQEAKCNKTTIIPQHQAKPNNIHVEAVDSPMIIEEKEEKEQWRVPPIKDNHTVDIFTEPEYAQDIYKYLKDTEVKHLPKGNYMVKQTDITHSMRSILIDWLVEVSEEYKLQTETLHLAVNYIDRFLSYMAVQRSKLQLVGAACMFIAAKYEEIYPPDVGEFVYITDDTYNKRQVLRMEHLVLKVLGFDLSIPTTFLFLNKIVLMDPLAPGLKDKIVALAAYLAELSLVDGDSFLKFTPSQVAAASVALARHTFEVEAWSAQLESCSGYCLDDLKACLIALHQSMEKAEGSSQQAVRDKYKASKYFNVSQLSPPSIF